MDKEECADFSAWLGVFQDVQSLAMIHQNNMPVTIMHLLASVNIHYKETSV